MVLRLTAGAAAAAAVVAAAVDSVGRRRLKQTQRAMRGQHAEALGRVPAAEQVAQDAMVALLKGRPVPIPRDIATTVSDLVHARLDAADVVSVLSRLQGQPAELYATCDAATRRRITLNFAAAYEVSPVLERAAMSALMPPEEVHAMARGPIAAGGDFYLADLIFDALAHAERTVADGATVLDFGSSSGRVLRAIAAGRPDLECIGCDPNEGAVAWAEEHLQMARFFVSPQRPPLPLDAGSVDLAYAVSIWSHFAEVPAIEWLAEMHRVLAPGGTLVITTHGLDCLTTLLHRQDMSDETAASAGRSLLATGHHFVDVFGPGGDWGVKDTGWGNAWLSLEWLLSKTGDDWSVVLDWPGALDQVQDVVVLQRR